MDSECTDSETHDSDRRFVQAAQPDPAVVLPYAGDHVVAVGLHVDVVDDRAAVVEGLDPDGPLGLGLEPVGDPGDRPAQRTSGRAAAAPASVSVGLAMVTQISPSEPRAMLSG